MLGQQTHDRLVVLATISQPLRRQSTWVCRMSTIAAIVQQSSSSLAYSWHWPVWGEQRDEPWRDSMGSAREERTKNKVGETERDIRSVCVCFGEPQ